MELGASAGAEGWKDVLQLLKEQNEKVERLARTLSIIQPSMLRKNPCHVRESVSGMLNTHKCLLESGVKIQKKMESHPVMKKLQIFQRPRLKSLGDTLKSPAKGEKRSAPSPPLEKTTKRGKGGPLSSYAQVATSQPPNDQGDWHVVMKKTKKKEGSKEKMAEDHIEGNEGKGRPPEGRSCGPVYPEDQEGRSPSSFQTKLQ